VPPPWLTTPASSTSGTPPETAASNTATSRTAASSWSGCSDMPFLWRCSDLGCGHVWKATPLVRSSFGSDCPNCARKNPKKHLSLTEERPDLVTEWHTVLNGGPSTGVTCGSGRSVWWTCGGCKRSWKARVADRASKGTGCPECWGLSRRQPRKHVCLGVWPRERIRRRILSYSPSKFGMSERTQLLPSLRASKYKHLGVF